MNDVIAKILRGAAWVIVFWGCTVLGFAVFLGPALLAFAFSMWWLLLYAPLLIAMLYMIGDAQ